VDHDFFLFVAPTIDGPAMVGLNTSQAIQLRDALDGWLIEKAIVDLDLCEACNIYVVLLNDHSCTGVM
jgi:hypothetical protein